MKLAFRSVLRLLRPCPARPPELPGRERRSERARPGLRRDAPAGGRAVHAGSEGGPAAGRSARGEQRGGGRQSEEQRTNFHELLNIGKRFWLWQLNPLLWVRS